MRKIKKSNQKHGNPQLLNHLLEVNGYNRPYVLKRKPKSFLDKVLGFFRA